MIGDGEEEGRRRVWERLWKHAGREGKDIKRDVRECAGERRKRGWGRGHLMEKGGVVGGRELVMCLDPTLSRGKQVAIEHFLGWLC